MNNLTGTLLTDCSINGSATTINPTHLNVSPITLNVEPAFLYIGGKRYTVEELDKFLTLTERLVREHYPEEFV